MPDHGFVATGFSPYIAAFLISIAVVVLLATPFAVRASEWSADPDKPYREALAQYRAGDLPGALVTAEQSLAENTRDLRLRFLRAVLLAGLGRTDAAVEAFREMTEQFPEVPEPWNNLAVLLAARGELDAALRALQDAIRAAPSYALAHENLGDLHIRLAARAYERALQAEPDNPRARERLALATELARQVQGQSATVLPQR